MSDRKRSWFRFSLANFLLAILVASMVLGYLYRSARSQRDAATKLYQNGFTLAYDRSSIDHGWVNPGFGGRHQAINKPKNSILDSPSNQLWLSSVGLLEIANPVEAIDGNRSWIDQESFPGFRDSDLKPVAKIAGVKELLLNYNSITDEGLKYLSRLTSLERLELSGCQISDIGMKHLANLKNLRHLSLADTDLTDAGIRKLNRLKNLRCLNLSNTDVSSGFLNQIHQWKKLEFLNLSRTKVGQKNIDRISQLTELNELCLSGTAVTDLGVVVKKLSYLIHLDIEHTSLGDDLIRQLEGKSLCSLTADGTNISGESVELIKGLGLEFFSGYESKLTVDEQDAIEQHIESQQ